MEIEYHILPDIFQLNVLTWLYVVKILCFTPNISPQPNKMTKCGPSWSKWGDVNKLSKCGYKYVINWWKSVGQFKMLDCIIWCIMLVGVTFAETKTIYISDFKAFWMQVCVFFHNYYVVHRCTMTFIDLFIVPFLYIIMVHLQIPKNHALVYACYAIIQSILA